MNKDECPTCFHVILSCKKPSCKHNRNRAVDLAGPVYLPKDFKIDDYLLVKLQQAMCSATDCQVGCKDCMLEEDRVGPENFRIWLVSALTAEEKTNGS